MHISFDSLLGKPPRESMMIFPPAGDNLKVQQYELIGLKGTSMCENLYNGLKE